MKRVIGPPSWAWLLAGIFVLQTAWTLVVPPYAGIDEFDHAYRAASVAHGQVIPGGAAENGRGQLVRVPKHIVEAAHQACTAFDYVGPDNCNSTAPISDGRLLVASAAGSYNPFYYALVGLPTLVLEGEAALYGMRQVNVLLCCLLIGLCLWLVSRQSNAAWATSGIALALTPVVMYASATVAPNGLEIVSGMTMWTIGLVIAYGSRPMRHHWWMLGAAMSLVATLHTTGPLWCVLFGACFLILPRGRAALRHGLSRERVALLGAAAGAVVVGVLDVAWTLALGANIRGGDDADLGAAPAGDVLREGLLWVFQTIGAVPFRNQHIPVPAMAGALIIFVIVLVPAWRRALLPERMVIVVLVVGFFGAGVITTVLTYDDIGLAWQGRYALPFACGLPLAATWILGRSRASRLTRMIPIAAWTMFAVVNGWSLIAVLDGQRAWESGLDWTAPPTSRIALLAVLGVAAVMAGVRTLGATVESVSTTRTPKEVAA